MRRGRPERCACVRPVPGHGMVRGEVHDLVGVGRNRSVGGDAPLEPRSAHGGGAQKGEAVVSLQAPGHDHATDHADCWHEGGGEALREALQHHLHDAQVRVHRQGPHGRVVGRREVLSEEDADLGRQLAGDGDRAEVPELREVDGAREELLEADHDLHDLDETDDYQEVAAQHPPDPVRGEVLMHVAVVGHEGAPDLPRRDDPEGQRRVEVRRRAALHADDGRGAEDQDHGLEEVCTSARDVVDVLAHGVQIVDGVQLRRHVLHLILHLPEALHEVLLLWAGFVTLVHPLSRFLQRRHALLQVEDLVVLLRPVLVEGPDQVGPDVSALGEDAATDP
mmetsp:Transcript_107569/g.335403  ORF Transcript_107569/g.335403 Transcript_107569/m.335403 type:complete len:336 (+) Transcript_107569:169-1176(+)